MPPRTQYVAVPRWSSVLACCVLANSFLLQMGVQRTPSAVKPAMAFDYVSWRCTGQISFIMGVLHNLTCVGGRNNEGEYPNMP